MQHKTLSRCRAAMPLPRGTSHTLQCTKQPLAFGIQVFNKLHEVSDTFEVDLLLNGFAQLWLIFLSWEHVSQPGQLVVGS